jgi:hypothetical protein
MGLDDRHYHPPKNMRNKLHAVLLVIIFTSASFIAGAQQKYALLVGINNYYDAPGVVNYHSLHGCVNDANSMKALLINRFGYSNTNIKTLYDADASKKHVVGALLSMVDKCKPGDAFVFYFSGHGVWAWDADNNSDPVKRGMNQAMVMSDLYSENLGCLLTDALIKKLFNKFVDKKVIVTSIFDCCFSGSLPMNLSPWGHNAYAWLNIGATEKSMPLDDIPFIQDGNTFLRNGMPDTLDYRVFNELFEPDDTVRSKDIAYKVERREDSSDATRSFNLKDVMRIFDPEQIPRPSERFNSKFLSLSATSDVEKGIEITDENSNRHGAFTNALLNVYKKNPADIPVSQLTVKIEAEMKKQHYSQSPTFHFEPSRVTGNLLGISPAGFTDKIVAKCVSARGNRVAIDMGSIAGVSKGNFFADTDVKESVVMQVDSINQNSSFGKIQKGNPAAVKAGHSFVLTKSYTRTTPFVKIYVPAAALTYAAFNDFFKKKITPLVKFDNYSDLGNFDNSIQFTYNIFYNDAVHANADGLKHVLSPKNADPFFVFLPIPAYISNPVIKLLQKNPNIEIVNSADKADFILYLNYIKGGEHTAGFVFSLQNFAGRTVMSLYDVYPWLTSVKDLNLTGPSLTKVTIDINDMVMSAARLKAGTRWLN